MPTTDKRVDDYIAKAAPFAQPILTHLRALAHEGCPDCEETLKWNSPAFMHNGIVFIMAAFKAHCAVNFWAAGEVLGDAVHREAAAGQLGKITKVADLPSKKLMLGYIKKSADLNDLKTMAKGKGATAKSALPKRVTKPKPEIPTPDYFVAALKKNRKAQAAFEKFAPSHRREYLEWITGAKAEATRDRRVAQAIEMIAEGKQRNWKYQ